MGCGCLKIGVPRKIFETKRDEVIGKWRRLHNDHLHDLYSYQLFSH